MRNRFEDIEQRAIDISGTSDYVSVSARRRKRARRFDDGQAADTVLEGKDKFRIGTVIVIINQLIYSLRQRIDAYREVREVFKVVIDINEVNADQIREYVVSMQIYAFIAEICSLANLLMKLWQLTTKKQL